MRQFVPVITLLGAFQLSGCQAGTESEPDAMATLPETLITCPDERPEVCTQQYDPVCGYAKPGVLLGDGQSSSQEWAGGSAVQPNPHRTFGNACSACGKAEVVGFVRGACPTTQ